LTFKPINQFQKSFQRQVGAPARQDETRRHQSTTRKSNKKNNK